MSRSTIKNYFAETTLFTRRVFVAIFFILVLTGLLIARLVYLQIDQHDVYITLSDQNQLSLIPIDPNRGLIYDRNGVLLAENVPVFSLDIIPDHLPHFKTTLEQLQKIIDITPDDLAQYHKELKQHRAFEPVPLKLNLSEEEVARFYLNQYRFPGVTVTARLMRYYPHGDIMVSALGYVARINEQELQTVDATNYSATNYIGKMGIEKHYENELHGSVGYQQVEMNADGRIVRTLKHIAPVSGDNLYLTIDSKLQKVAEDALGDDQGAVVAIDPRNGQVLALVSNPRYDPNLFVQGISSKDYKILQQAPNRPLYNRALRGLYAPGSTVKPFLSLEALDSGTVTPSFTIFDPGWFKLPNASHVYKDWNWKKGGHGVVNIYKAIVQSCDVFFYNLSLKLGINRWDYILSSIGYGQRTGIDVDEELPGVLPSPAWKMRALGQQWYPGDTVNAAIGQGYTLITPLQAATAAEVMGDRGRAYIPHLLLKIQKPDGTILQAQPEPKNPVILQDPRIWSYVISAMKDVVQDPRGTAHKLYTTSYTIAAKTGTAQVFRPKQYGDEDSPSIPKKYRSHSWLLVFAPVNNPQIALGILVENHPHQATVVAKQVLDYYLLPNHGQAMQQMQGMPDIPEPQFRRRGRIERMVKGLLLTAPPSLPQATNIDAQSNE